MPIGIWSDRVGRKKVLALGYALFALTALGFAFVTSLAGLIALFALYGLVYALVDGSERAYVSDLSPGSLRGSSLGLYYGAIGVAAIISSLAGRSPLGLVGSRGDIHLRGRSGGAGGHGAAGDEEDGSYGNALNKCEA